MESIDIFLKFLQSCITPIVLISGVGLILLSLTNRLGRTIDKSRMIVINISEGKGLSDDKKRVELKILFERSKILRNSIVCISFSILTSSMLIPIMLVMNLFHFDLRLVGILLFLLSTLGIIFSSIFLFIDVRLSLKALEFEVEDYI